MRFRHMLKRIGENFFVGLGGAFIGAVISLLYFLRIWLPTYAEEIGLGIIALIPVMVIMFSIIGIVVGGILGIVVYHIVQALRKK